jgi:inorganic pyrophosphatase
MSMEYVNALTVNVFIEIAKGSHIKYEYDNEKKALVCDRILHTPFKYEFKIVTGILPQRIKMAHFNSLSV